MNGKVIVVAQTPPPVHGSTMMAARLLDAIGSTGYTPVLVDKRFSSRIEQVGRTSLRKIAAAPGLWFRLTRALRDRPVATVLFVTDRPGSFIVDAVSTAIVIAARVRLIHQVHSQGFQALAARGWLWRWGVRAVLRAADQVTCASPGLAGDLSGFVSHDRLHFIPNTVGDSVDASRVEQSPPTLLFVANLFPSKRPDLVIDVVELLEAEGIRVRARIAGAPSDAEFLVQLQRRIEGSPSRERIDLIGPIDATRRSELFREASLLLHPTSLDAQPLVILEAMSAGLPVVATRVGGIPDLIKESLVGRLAPPGDAEGLALAVQAVLRETSVGGDRERRAHYDSIHGLHAFAANWALLLAEGQTAERERPA